MKTRKKSFWQKWNEWSKKHPFLEVAVFIGLLLTAGFLLLLLIGFLDHTVREQSYILYMALIAYAICFGFTWAADRTWMHIWLAGTHSQEAIELVSVPVRFYDFFVGKENRTSLRRCLKSAHRVHLFGLLYLLYSVFYQVLVWNVGEQTIEALPFHDLLLIPIIIGFFGTLLASLTGLGVPTQERLESMAAMTPKERKKEGRTVLLVKLGIIAAVFGMIVIIVFAGRWLGLSESTQQALEIGVTVALAGILSRIFAS